MGPRRLKAHWNAEISRASTGIGRSILRTQGRKRWPQQNLSQRRGPAAARLCLVPEIEGWAMAIGTGRAEERGLRRD